VRDAARRLGFKEAHYERQETAGFWQWTVWFSMTTATGRADVDLSTIRKELDQSPGRPQRGFEVSEERPGTLGYRRSLPLAARLCRWVGNLDDRPLMPLGLGLAATAWPHCPQGLGPSSGELTLPGLFFLSGAGDLGLARIGPRPARPQHPARIC
jgi:hypothetical protein